MKSFILKFFITALSLLCFKIQAQQLGFRILNGQKKVNIPFELHSNLIIIPVVLNHQLPLKFILDTGVRTTILTEKAFSDILNLTYSKKYTISGIGDDHVNGIQAYITNGVSLTMPGITGNGHAMLVLEEDYLELRNYLGTEVHGILGYELFSRFVVKIDYDNKILTISAPDNFKPGIGYDEIPLTIEDTKPYVHVKIFYNKTEKIDLKLMVDSGASHGLLLDEKSSPKIHLPEKYLEASLGRGLEGKLFGKIARIERLKLGSRYWDDVLVTFPNGAVFMDSLKRSEVYRNGSFGGEILSRFKVIFDFPGEKMYLKKGNGFKREFSYNLSGIDFKAIGSELNTFQIVDVRDSSTAYQAGVRKGDNIISINGIDANTLQLGHLTNILNQREKKKITLEVLRDNKKITTSFRLKSQI